ncbi:MAG: hypothetical protein M9962_06865 [Oligoflexia bacterium]|nr:hypothetical protein [Oligoflexia bacterium]
MIPILIEQLNLQIKRGIDRAQEYIASIYRSIFEKYRKLQSVKKRTFTRKGSRVFRRMIPLKSLSNIAQLPGNGSRYGWSLR